MNEAISWLGRVNRLPSGGRLPFGIRIHVEHPSLLAEVDFGASSILCSSIDLDVSTDHIACGLLRSHPCVILKSGTLVELLPVCHSLPRAPSLCSARIGEFTPTLPEHALVERARLQS
jgi:hypothetical protein